MKNKFFTLLFACMTSMGCLFAQQPLISIDGNFSDWGQVPSTLLAEAMTDNNPDLEALSHIKFCTDTAYIYCYVEFDATDGAINTLNILMNTDNDATTGYESWLWADCGAEYLIESYISDAVSANLYKYCGDPSDRTFFCFYVGRSGECFYSQQPCSAPERA